LFAEPPKLSTFVRLGIGGLREASQLDAWTTMQRALEAKVASPHLRDILARYATYNGSDPRRAPATLHCIAHVELVEGASAVAGGTHALVSALERAARRLGVEIETGTPIRRILTERGRVAGVETQRGARVQARAVVANADVAHVAGELLPRASARSLDLSAEPSTSGWCAIVRAVRREERAGHTVLFPTDYRAEFVDLFDRGRPPTEPAIYLCAQEKSHGRTGWTSHEPIFVMVNAPAEPATKRTPDATWAALEERVLGRLRRARLIDAEDAVVWRRTPSDLADRFPGSRGSIYGPASHGIQAAFKRAPNAVAEIPGLYLASGSVHPGGGMPLAALSGMNAGRAALRLLGPRDATVSMEES
jgi:phytoene dehydrogenase-like protein